MSADPSITSTLLQRLGGQDADAWHRLVLLYSPIVRGWCRRVGLQDDAADVAQEVFIAVTGNLDRFQRDGGRNSFRGWLYGITRNQLLAHWRRCRRQPVRDGVAQQNIADVAEAVDLELSIEDEQSDRRIVLRRAVELLRNEVEEHTWLAFWRTAVECHALVDVAADLGISPNAVYLAKARLLRRLPEEFGEMLD